MKKEICWISQDCSAHMSRFIYKNKLKKEDIISINRLKDGTLELWFWANDWEDLCLAEMKEAEQKKEKPLYDVTNKELVAQSSKLVENFIAAYVLDLAYKYLTQEQNWRSLKASWLEDGECQYLKNVFEAVLHECENTKITRRRNARKN